MKIGIKLIISYIFIVGIVAVGGIITLNLAEESLRKLIGEKSTLITNEILEGIDRNIFDKINESEQLASSSKLQELIASSNKEFSNFDNVDELINIRDNEWISLPKETVTPFMANIIDNTASDLLRKKINFYQLKYGFQVFSEIFVTNAYGANVAQSGKTTDYKQSDEEWWQMAKQNGLFLKDVEYDKSADVYSVDIAVRIEDEDGNFLGVIKNVVNIEDLIQVIKNAKTNSEFHSEYDWIASDGRLIYSTEPHHTIFDDMSSEAYFTKTFESSENYLVTLGLEEENTEQLFAWAQSGGYRTFTGFGWILVSEYQTKEIFSSISELKFLFMMISGIALACIAMFGLIMSRSIVFPISSLKSAIEKIKEGNLDVLIEPKGNDEITDLSVSFKSMVDSLKISKKLESEAQLKYKNLYENSPALHRTINTNGIILDCNESYAKRFGYTKDEIIGSSIFKYVTEQSKNDLKKSYETWKHYGTVNNREVWFITKNGETFPALVSANNLYDKNGKLIGSNTIIREITDFYNAKKADEERNKAQENVARIKKIDKMKEEFSSMVTHELKTPLTPIKGYCEMLADESFGTLTETQVDYVKKINCNAMLLERLIGDVLDVQKLDMEKMSFNKESFDVCDFLDRLKQDSACIMKDKGIEFVLTDDVKMTLKTDQLRLRQVLENLIRNSVDFVPSKNGKIEVGAKQENGKIIFHVKDNGIGVPKDEQQNVFKKFYQVDTSHTRKHGGTGLGLVICKGIVDALGGEIWFESEPGIVTTFYFSVPIYIEKITMESKH